MATRVTILDIKLLPGEPEAFTRDPTESVMRDLERRMTLVRFGARSKVRKRTGYLMSTIRMNSGGDKRGGYVDVIAGRTGGKTKYLMAEHDGTRAHEIRPRRRKTLRFMVGGQVVFSGRVWHPGTTGTHFLTGSLILAAG